ncbi:hypothetical protein RRG08_049734 [Elysia crispata]|uniref:Uncharacterized protein n=1 Tax=Elysia crispata TaxID=231223 RepID=A0AAE1CUU5_9GAST|nr:hypothetical protein RRG08_049734 [Elysia crispata]
MGNTTPTASSGLLHTNFGNFRLDRDGSKSGCGPAVIALVTATGCPVWRSTRSSRDPGYQNLLVLQATELITGVASSRPSRGLPARPRHVQTHRLCVASALRAATCSQARTSRLVGVGPQGKAKPIDVINLCYNCLGQKWLWSLDALSNISG